jgi:hypothetical protein
MMKSGLFSLSICASTLAVSSAATAQGSDVLAYGPEAEAVAGNDHAFVDLETIIRVSQSAPFTQTASNSAAGHDPKSGAYPLKRAGGGPYRVATFRRETKAVRWEVVGAAAAITATRIGRLVKRGPTFTFKNEGWFGKSTDSLGMDKIHHAFKTYVIADVLQGLIRKRSGNAESGPESGSKSGVISGALIGLGLMTYGELYDGLTKGHGWSNEDMVAHMAGAGFAVLRNSVPGLREKIDFRMLTMPTFRGDQTDLTNLLAQRKYLFAAQLSGFKTFERSPLRFVELHLGYYGRGFTEKDRALGLPLRRRLYFGVGINLQQLFPKKPKSTVFRLSKGALDYFQLPYTSIH